MATGRLIADRFEVGPRVGSGGMGHVFRAIDRDRDIPVAVKLLRAGFDSDRFHREARLLAQVSDRHVVGYVAHGVDADGAPYLVMDWIDGHTLQHRLAYVGLDVAESVALALAAARGLAAAHRVGVVHRDVKPSNILLAGGDPGEARIIDFGIGRQHAEASLTRSGAVLGTPAYMAPEQARGARALDPRADVFALGVILYECLTGAPAFSGSNPLAVQCKVLAFSPPPLAGAYPHAPAPLVALCERMLAKQPAHRPTDGDAVVSALAALAIPGAGPRRARLHEAGVPTTPAGTTVADSAPPQARFVVLSTPPLDDDGVAVPLAEGAGAALIAHAAAAGVVVAPLHDGTWLAVVEDADPAQGATRAGRLGLGMAALVPGGEVVISGARGADSDLALGAAIEDGSHALMTSVRATLFAAISGQARPGPVRVDALTAGLLPARFVVARADGVAWLVEEATA